VIFLVIIVYCFLAVYEFVPLYKQKLWNDFWVNVILGLISFTVAVLLSLDVKISSPVYAIPEIIESIFGK